MRSRAACAVVAALVALGCEAAERGPVSPEKRYRQLVGIIDRNVGYAHGMRGMNLETIDALRKAVTRDDIPVLRRMLVDADRVVALTAVNVLADMGPQGRAAIYETLLGAIDDDARFVVADELGRFASNKAMKDWILAWLEDIPLLKTMAASGEVETMLAARYVLEAMGDPGRQAIDDVVATSRSERTWRILKDNPWR